MRTLILLLICLAFVVGGVLDARAEAKGLHHIIRTGVIALFVGMLVCYVLVDFVGIFDNWKYSWRR